MMLAAAGLLAGCAEEGKVISPGGRPGEFALRVNCGDLNPYVDPDGLKWKADQIFVGLSDWGAIGGQVVTRDEDLVIEGTKAQRLYKTERWAASGYFFTLPNGDYTVRLHFAETFPDHKQEGKRIFTVKLNGKTVLKKFDVFKEAGGFAKPVVKQFKSIPVTGRSLEIDFVPVLQGPVINAIEILRQ